VNAVSNTVSPSITKVVQLNINKGVNDQVHIFCVESSVALAQGGADKGLKVNQADNEQHQT